jgi:uncharacterized membrane protein YfcA
MFVEGSIPPAPPVLVIAMIAGGIGGGLIGSRIVKAINDEQVDRLFSIVLWLVILLSAYNTIRLAIPG